MPITILKIAKLTHFHALFLGEIALQETQVFFNSPVNECSKMASRKKYSVVLKFGKIVDGNVLNNMPKVCVDRR